MGIFDKKKKISPHPPKADSEPTTDISTFTGAAAVNLSDKTVVIQTPDGAVKKKLPDSLDATDKAALGEFIGELLTKEGLLPPGAELTSLDIKKADRRDVAGLLDKVFNQDSDDSDESANGIAERFLKMRGHETPDIDLPADPTKAQFIRALNCLHKKTHELAPMVADLMTSLECLRLVAKANPSSKQDQAFKKFERCLVGALKAMDTFGTEVCSFSAKVEAMGVPVPDATSTTVN